MFSFPSESLQTKLQKWIEIAEENDRNFGLPADKAHNVQDFCQPKTMSQGALRSSLNHRPVSHRIAERDTEFDDARANACEFENQIAGSVQIRIAGGDERNEALATFAFELLECLCDSGQKALPQRTHRNTSANQTTISRS